MEDIWVGGDKRDTIPYSSTPHPHRAYPLQAINRQPPALTDFTPGPASASAGGVDDTLWAP